VEFRIASRKTVAILSSVFFLGCSSSISNGAETGTQEAIERTGQEFSTIKASAKEAVEKLNSAWMGCVRWRPAEADEYRKGSLFRE